MGSRFNILLADDHVMLRRGVRRIIEGFGDVEVVGEANDGLELLELLKKTSPNLIIMDISMPKLRGLEATREIKIINPAVKVLILTMHKDEDYLYKALSAGADGYLLKEDAESELLSAIDTLGKGGTYISPLVSMHLTKPFTSNQEILTTREREVLKLVAEGKSSKEVANLLSISSKTVQHHRANIMRKLNIKKTTELVKYAIQKGYIAPHT